MSDFTDFLAAMAIEDSMEEEPQHPSPRHPSETSSAKTTKGCLLAGAGILIACALGVALKSFWLSLALGLLSFVSGAVYDAWNDIKKKSHKENDKEKIER